MLLVIEVNQMFLCVFMFLGPFVHADFYVLYWSILGFFFGNIELKVQDIKVILVVYVKKRILLITPQL